jgi:hypothetical protein
METLPVSNTIYAEIRRFLTHTACNEIMLQMLHTCTVDHQGWTYSLTRHIGAAGFATGSRTEHIGAIGI